MRQSDEQMSNWVGVKHLPLIFLCPRKRMDVFFIEKTCLWLWRGVGQGDEVLADGESSMRG